MCQDCGKGSAAAQIQPLDWELPNATGMAVQRKIGGKATTRTTTKQMEFGSSLHFCT